MIAPRHDARMNDPMNYEHLFSSLAHRQIRIALVGPKGAFGRSLLAQCRVLPNLHVAALCDLDIDGTLATLNSLGVPADAVRVCATEAEVLAATAASRIALVSNHGLLNPVALDVIVEATGQPEVSVMIAENALKRGVHVVMAIKETDSVAGPYLNRLALENGVVYSTGDGDQPSNAIGLVTWARVLGFEVVAAGKSSEYDFIYDPAAQTVDYLEQRHAVPSLAAAWPLGDDIAATLAARSQALAMLPQSATPDYCEMNIVANSTGLAPASPSLNFPLARITELADIFALKADGGILDHPGVVDVFNCLRRPDEASFAGGVFVVVRAHDDETWQLLRQKGHVLSRNGRYACIYQPYHLMGLETPMTIFSALSLGQPTGSAAQLPRAQMVARACRDFGAGETLAMGGHNHHIDGTVALLLDRAEAGGLAPYYLAANKRLAAGVAAGSMIPLSALRLEGSALFAAWQRNP
jgi:predicted homoserine dehydrogenase-like protein